MEILYRHDVVLISQRKFTVDLLKKFDSMNYKLITSPLDCNDKLKVSDGNLIHDPTYYRKLVGKLNFLTHIRMGISYSV